MRKVFALFAMFAGKAKQMRDPPNFPLPHGCFLWEEQESAAPVGVILATLSVPDTAC
jgi:hypothetical protein